MSQTTFHMLAADLQTRVPAGFEVRGTVAIGIAGGLPGPTVLITGYYGSSRLRYSLTDRGDTLAAQSLDKFRPSAPDSYFGDQLVVEWADPDSMDHLDRFLRQHGLRLTDTEE